MIALLVSPFYILVWFLRQVGISLAARKYDLTDARPFQTSDIMNLQPVVKHSIPVCSEARDLVETGKVQLAEVRLISSLFYGSFAYNGYDACTCDDDI